MIAFPRLEVEVFSKEVIAHFVFIDIISPFAYFVKSKEKGEKEEPNHLETVKNEQQCASKALKSNEFFGYEYCKDKNEIYCDLLDGAMIRSTKNNKDHCVIKEKIDSAKAKQLVYETLDEKIEIIKRAAEERSLKVITHKGESLTFNQLHRIAEESQIDRSQLYKKKKENRKVADKKSVKIFNRILNLQSCFDACANPLKDFKCDSFSFCKRHDVFYECNLADLNRGKDLEEGTFEEDEACDFYEVSALQYFQESPNKKLKAESDKEGGPILRSFAESTSFECK